jgi:hypothetical protein
LTVRFFFRGLLRDDGKPVEGHVEAADTDSAYNVLSANGIVTESLRDDPKPLNVSPTVPAIPQFADALESALDSSSCQVPFDDLTERYRGKKVWVIDRDKIRQRVAQVVDTTLASSEANSESGQTARERVADAISGLFHDNRNIASEHTAESVAKMQAMMKAASGANGLATMNDKSLADQIGRLTGVVEQAEGLIAAMSAALRNIETGAVPRRQVVMPSVPSVLGGEQKEVLREIFMSNLELRRGGSDGSGDPGLKKAG